MRRFRRNGLLLLLLSGLASCEVADDLETVPPDNTALPAPGEVRYSVDTLTFVREGRPVVFNDREWWPQEEPVFDPLVTPVGTFEGIVLYAAADETLPYNRLFIPAEGNRWLALMPRSRLP